MCTKKSFDSLRVWV
ncbi:unnamed protein product [Acanthoscelides obtectus]|uniref:Uncharacterized protein n=1 Tax=Acanthoscelides obtectus TaxID=200917 RepID=A0A9P0Q7W7_ACAOB|nr:unnamed protein product [Acanthoscelides obtectus]